VLDEIAASGFAGTELGDWGFMPTEPGALRHAVASRSLSLVGAFVPVNLGKPADIGLEMALKTAHLLADAGSSGFIVLADENGTDPVRTRMAGRIQPELGLSESQWSAAAAWVNQIARTVKEKTGLRTVFHHHAAGMVETPLEVEALMARTDPDLLGLCLDTGHWAFGGGDPLDAVNRWSERIWHVHFKDWDRERMASVIASNEDYFSAVCGGVFCELGLGGVDFPAIVQALRAAAYEGWIVVEQDVLPSMGTPLKSAIRNRDYLTGLGL
jgi:inosose dehydratase